MDTDIEHLFKIIIEYTLDYVNNQVVYSLVYIYIRLNHIWLKFYCYKCGIICP